jgi:ABC-2 type transport system permease protein
VPAGAPSPRSGERGPFEGGRGQPGLTDAMLLSSYTLWLREVVRFYRDRSRVFGALGSPLVFWFLIGSGLGRSFHGGPSMPLPGGYLEYFYPGTLALIMLFTAIFSTISIIEDRREGFLQGVLVAPVPRSAIVLGKILGGTTLAAGQSLVFLLLAPLAHVSIGLAELPALAAVLLVLSFGLTGLGFLIAWRLDSSQGFHAIMNLFLIPMWILSGALFPAGGAAGWVRVLMWINPLTYGVSALRTVLYGRPVAGDPPLPVSFAVIAVFAGAMLVLGALAVRQGRARSH